MLPLVRIIRLLADQHSNNLSSSKLIFYPILHKLHDLHLLIILKLFGKYFNLANFFSFLVYILYMISWSNRKRWKRACNLSCLNKSKKINKIYCFPGNAGTAEIAENVNININNFNELKKFVLQKINCLLIVGPEKPLVDGIVDFFEKQNIKVFGPNKIASQLEGSKIFTKRLCEKYNIPTAKFGIFETLKKANDFLDQAKFPLVIKADGSSRR